MLDWAIWWIYSNDVTTLTNQLRRLNYDKKTQVLEIKRGKDQTKEQALAEFQSKSEYLSTAIIESFCVGLGDDFSFQSTMQVLEKTIQKIQSGDLSKIGEMYIS